MPRIVDMEVQQEEAEGGGNYEKQGSKVTSARAMLYLVSLKEDKKVLVRHPCVWGGGGGGAAYIMVGTV